MINVIPAIDLMDGKCVRLQKGDFDTKKIYHDDPLEMAKHFEALGIRQLHLVDLDGAKAQQPQNLAVLQRLAAQTDLLIDFGGGLRSKQHLQQVLDAGATQVTCGSVAVKQPKQFAEWIENFGAEKFILAADVHGDKIAVHGWQDTSSLKWQDFLQDYWQQGIRHVLCTDISKDGMLSGPAFELYADILAAFPELQLIASGGISQASDITRLDQMGVPAVVVGKAIYEGKISDEELQGFATD